MRILLILLFRFVFIAVVLSLCALFLWGRTDFEKGKTFSRDFLQYPIIFTDRYGVEIHRIFGTENRDWMAIEEVPEMLKQATILAEDRRFKYHFGVDPIGITRAMWVNFKSGKFTQGASTLTQQVARKAFLNDEKKIHRKLREIFLAMGIESKFTKNDILEIYLNTVPYGARSNGVSVASRFYFNKPPSDLSPAQSLILTMLPQNPVSLGRKTNVKDWLGSCPEKTTNCNLFETGYQTTRIEKVLLALAEQNKWSRAKTYRVWQELKLTKLPRNHNWVHSDFQHFQFYVRDYLAKKDLDIASIKDGIIIKTSLDANLQKDISQQLRQASKNLTLDHNIQNTAFIILDNKSRKPLVWIGSRYFWDSDISGQLDMLRSNRQVGSTMKPFIYSAAIDQGYEPPTIFYDSALMFRNGPHNPKNADGHYLGGIRMTEALAKSRNIPAAKALILGGGERIVRKYLDTKFGFNINKQYKKQAFGWTISLGTAPIKLSRLANAYATLSTGKRQSICPVISVKTLGGKTLGNFCDQRRFTTLSDTTRFFMSDILSNTIARPTDYGWRDNITVPDYNIAVKTGTSSKRIDGNIYPVDDLVVGYSPNHTFLLWGGNTSGEALNQGSVSVIAIGKIWNKAVQRFYKKYPTSYAHFEKPSGLKLVHGEWATNDYLPPSYDRLNAFVLNNKELGLNPLNKLN